MAAVGAMVLDPERLLWVPGQRSFVEVHRPVRVLGGGLHQVHVGELLTTSTFPKRYVKVSEDGVVEVVRLGTDWKSDHIFYERQGRCPCGAVRYLDV